MNNCKGEDLECFAWARRRFFLWNDDHHYHRQKSLKVLKLCKGHVEWTGYRMQWQRLHWEGRVRKTQHKKTDEVHWDIGTNRKRIPKTVQFQQKKNTIEQTIFAGLTGLETKMPHHWQVILNNCISCMSPSVTHTHVRLGDVFRQNMLQFFVDFVF